MLRKSEKTICERSRPETGEFLPEPYVRAFVKLYANEVGLNGEQLLRKYDIQQVEKKHSLSQLPEDETVSENPPIEEQDIEQFSSNKVLNYFEKHRIESYFIIASLLIVIILAFVYYQKGNEIFDATVEQRIPEISIDSLLIAESDSGTSQIPSELHLELLIRAIEETWISISIDDSARRRIYVSAGPPANVAGKEPFYAEHRQSPGHRIVFRRRTVEAASKVVGANSTLSLARMEFKQNKNH